MSDEYVDLSVSKLKAMGVPDHMLSEAVERLKTILPKQPRGAYRIRITADAEDLLPELAMHEGTVPTLRVEYVAPVAEALGAWVAIREQALAASAQQRKLAAAKAEYQKTLPKATKKPTRRTSGAKTYVPSKDRS